MVRDAEQFATTDKKRKEMIEVSLSVSKARNIRVKRLFPTPPFQLSFSSKASGNRVYLAYEGHLFQSSQMATPS